MSAIKSCEFNIDNACVELVYENGSMISIYTPMIGESLRTTAYSRSKLDWPLDNAPLEYARLVIDGTIQEYVDNIDDSTQRKMKSYSERLAKHYPKNIAEDIAREMLMYG